MNLFNKKKCIRTFFTVTALFTMLFCLAGCSKKTPREALEEAWQKTFVEENPAEALLGLTELGTKLNENKAHSAGYSFTIQEISGKDLGNYAGYLSGLGLSVDSASDLLNRKSIATMDITYGGTTYLTLGGQIQGSELFLTVPQLLDSSLTVDLSTIEEDLNSDSMIGQLLRDNGITLPDDLFANLSQALTVTPENAESLITAWEDLDAAIVVEKLGKKKISLPDTVTAKKVYNVTVPKHAYVAFVNACLDYSDRTSASLTDAFGLSEEATQQSSTDLLDTKLKFQEFADSIGDVVITVAVTKNGYINYMTSTVTAEEDTATFTASFTGENAPLEVCEVVIDATMDQKAYHFDLTLEFDTETNEIDVFAVASEDNTQLFSFDCVGTFNHVEKGQKFTLDLDYLELEYGTDFSLSLAGDYYVDTTVCDIPAPAPSERNLLRMSQADFTALLIEVSTNLKEDPLLSGILGMLDFGL